MTDGPQSAGEKAKTRRGRRSGTAYRKRIGLAAIEVDAGDPAIVLPRPWMRKFLGVLRRTGNVTWAARTVKMSRQNAYLQRDKCEVFGALWDDALEGRTDLLEQKLYDRATFGVVEDVYGGVGDGITGVVGQRVKHDNGLGTRMLAANREKYRSGFTPEEENGARDAAALIRAFAQEAAGTVPSSKATEAPDWGAQRLGDAVDEAAPEKGPDAAPARLEALPTQATARLCTDCGHGLAPRMRFCPNCGADLTPAE